MKILKEFKKTSSSVQVLWGLQSWSPQPLLQEIPPSLMAKVWEIITEKFALFLPCFSVALLESYTGLWRFLTRPSVGIFLGLPDETLCLTLLCVAVCSCDEETSGQFYGGVLQLFDTGTVNWFWAISSHPIHTNKSFHFITLPICTTVMSGSCSCHIPAKPNVVPVPCTTTTPPKSSKLRGCFNIFSIFFRSLAIDADSVETQGTVSLLSKLLQLWGKMSFQKDFSVL